MDNGQTDKSKINRHRQSPNDMTVGPDGLRADNTQCPVRDIRYRGQNGMINIKFIRRVNHWTPQPLCIQSRCTHTEVNNQ
ncbi:hypothetical protein N7471_011458 [Penicillium samsonianum]|uniref:uncharacterized protein n=1 Tax=Penicillium samsonianum TaxID=1882272 RepID=UPI002548FCC0|nr:uncharacterized protein N7471_011458 [Penicillium samsonianum]KAJ6124141.1 hypothetical protein N7471_011458 [Penicillium samsonianum]